MTAEKEQPKTKKKGKPTDLELEIKRINRLVEKIEKSAEVTPETLRLEFTI